MRERHIEVFRNGNKRVEIDMTPVVEFMTYLKDVLNGAREPDYSREISAIKEMTSYQLTRLVLEVLSELRLYHKLYLHSYTKEHLDFVQKLKEIKKMAKDGGYDDFWPEIP